MNSEATLCSDRSWVRFAIYPDGFDGPRILAEISEHALRGLFGARGERSNLVQAREAHFELIEARAIACYLAQPLNAVKLGTPDFSTPSAMPGAAAAGPLTMRGG